MKYKMTAVLVALAMMFAGVFVMANGDGTDAAPKTQTVSIDQGATLSYQILTNEKMYIESATANDYKYTAKWTLGDVELGTATTTGGITYTVAAVTGTDNVGLYNVTVTASNNASASAEKSDLIFTVTLTFGSSQTMVLTNTYEFNVTATAVTAITLKDMTAVQNVPFTQKVEVNEGSMTIDNYNWYAIGLPEGLGMAKDGTISGLATKALVATDYKVTAVENNSTGVPRTYALTLKLGITATESGSVVLTFDNAQVAGATEAKITFSGIGGTGAVAPTTDTAYVEEGTSDVAFAVSAGEGSTKVIVTKVMSIDSDGTEKEITATSDKYALNTSGTGSYKTKVYVNVDGQSAVLMFNLLVVENLHGDWAPSVVIIGN